MRRIGGHRVRELRCENCRAFITYERIFAGIIVHVCPKCGHENVKVFKFLDVPSVHNMINSSFSIKLPRKEVTHE